MSDNRYGDRTKRIRLDIPLSDETFGSIDERIDLLEFEERLDAAMEERNAGEVVDSMSGGGRRTMLIEGAWVPSSLAAIRRAAKRMPLPAGTQVEVWNPRTESWEDRQVPGMT